MRITVFAWRDLAHPRAGGAEVYIHEVARRWVKWGHQVTLVAAAVADHPARDRLDGVDIVRGGSAVGVYRQARHWYAAHGRGRTDLVIDEINTRPFGCRRWVHDAPVLALAHQVCREVWSAELPLPVALLGRHVLEPWWLKTYAHSPVLTVSESSRESLREYGLTDVHVVGIGKAERSRPEVARAAVPTVIYLGRLSANKRPDDAVRAFAQVRAALPEAEMHVVGDGPMRAHLERTAGPGVRFHGRVPGVVRDQLLAMSHALVVTSIREGWGLVVDEAAAMGTPAFGYDVPGLRDALRAAHGIVTKPNPESLAAALIGGLPRLFAQPATRGWSGGARSWDAVAADILDHARSPVAAGVSRVA